MAALLERSRARSDFILGEIFLPDFRGNPSNCCWHFSVWLTDWYYVFKNVGSDSYKVLLMGPKWFEALRSLRETRLWNTESLNYFSIDGSVKKLWSSLNKKLTENSLNKDVKCAIKCFHVESGQNLWTELFSVDTTGSWTHLSLTADFKITFLIIFYNHLLIFCNGFISRWLSRFIPKIYLVWEYSSDLIRVNPALSAVEL